MNGPPGFGRFEMKEYLPMHKLVLLPGMDGTGELFAGFVKALPEGFDPVIMRYPIDRPLSYADLLECPFERQSGSCFAQMPTLATM
jgi:hypothetical protein